MGLLGSQHTASFWRGVLPLLVRRSLLLTLIYTLLTEALSTLLLSPLVLWGLDLLIALSGKTVIANFGIVSFLRSPIGIVVIVIGLIGFIFVGLAQLAALLVVNVRALEQRPTSLYGVVRVLIANASALFRTALALASVVLAIGIPLVALAGLTYWLLLRGFDINYFLATMPPRFLFAAGMAGVLIVIGLVAAAISQVRYIFVAPIVLFEGKAGFNALRASAAMVRGHSWRVVRVLLLWVGIAFALVIVSSLLLSASFALVTLPTGANTAAFAITLAMVFLVIVLIGVFQQVIPAFLHAALIAHLYVEQRARLGQTAWPELPRGLDANVHHVVNSKLRLSLFGATGLFVLALSGVVGLGAQALGARPNIIIMAHRAGAAGVPENSLTALRRTIAQGIAAYAELDVQETADGVVVVIHDSDLRRLANVDARVWELTYAQIAQADIGRTVGPQFVGERIPTLSEFLDTAKGKIKLNIELKYDRDAPLLAGKVINLVRAKGMQDAVVISSLNPAGLTQVRQLAPELTIGLIYQFEIGNINRLDVDFLEPEAARVSALIGSANARGLPVYAWTIDDAETAQRMYDAGVSAVITNDPPLVRQALDTRGALSDPERIVARFRQLFDP